MRLKPALTLFAAMAILAGPAAGLLYSFPADAGVSVGNAGPQLAYWSPEGKFGVQYAAELSLKVANQAAFEISNEKLVGANETTSRVAFSVDSGSAGSQAEFAAAVRKEYPHRLFVPVEFNGTTALASEEQRGNHLDGLYFMLNADQTIIRARVDASSDANGIELIAPIVKTFAADTTPPIVKGLRLANPVWQAGEQQTILLQATDELSGIESLSNVQMHLLNERGENPGEPESFRYRLGGFNSKTEFKPLGDNWYSWTFPLGANLPAGDYAIVSLVVSDRAKNWTSLSARQKDEAHQPIPPYYRAATPLHGGPSKMTTIPVLKVKVINAPGKVDVTNPVFHGFRTESLVWEAGSTHRVYFRATDNHSRIDIKRSTLASFSDAKKNFYIGGPGKMRDEGNGWYSDEYTVPATQPSGEYFSAFPFLLDEAENLAREGEVQLDPGLTFPLRITVKNSGREERRPLSVDAWRFDKSSVSPGGSIRLSVHFAGDRTDLEQVDASIDGPDGSGLTEFSQDFKNLGRGWYELNFKIGDYAPAGVYRHRGIEARSEVGSQLDFDCTMDAQKCSADGSGAQLPKLGFRVVR